MDKKETTNKQETNPKQTDVTLIGHCVVRTFSDGSKKYENVTQDNIAEMRRKLIVVFTGFHSYCDLISQA